LRRLYLRNNSIPLSEHEKVRNLVPRGCEVSF
jgi:hypothetical protein